MQMKAAYILVDPQMYTEAKFGSIIIPDNIMARKKFARGTVVSVGPGLVLPMCGEHSRVEVDAGDSILYYKEYATPIQVEGKEMHIIEENQVLATLEPGEFAPKELALVPIIPEGETNGRD